jgi:ribose/xylose/arabinose/galactoside ABC-type transport system permease subunit
MALGGHRLREVLVESRLIGAAAVLVLASTMMQRRQLIRLSVAVGELPRCAESSGIDAGDG